MGKYISKRPRHAACGILVHRPGIEPGPPAVGVQSLNHWTARASVHAMRNKGNKKISFPFRSPQSTEQSFLCYTAGSVPTRIGIHFRNKGGHVDSSVGKQYSSLAINICLTCHPRIKSRYP
ncbi:uncharacterized protein AAG666_006460 isoform 8-T26 [Megaptera novaeangliae]